MAEENEEKVEQLVELRRKYTIVTDKFESHASLASRKTETLQQQLDAATAAAQKHIADVNRLQAELDDALTRRSEESRKLQEEQNWNVIRDELHRQATSFRKLEAENARLTTDLRLYKTRAESVQVLREEKMSLEKRLQRAEEYREQAARLQAEVDAARQERAKWCGTSCLIHRDRDSHMSRRASQKRVTPTSVVAELNEQRLKYASLLEAHGALKVDLQEKQAAVVTANEASEEAQKLVSDLRAKADELEDAAVKRERRVKLADEEVAFLNALVVRGHLLAMTRDI